MSSAPGLRPPRVDKSVYFAPRPPQLPYALSLQGSEITTARLDGGGGPDRAVIVCGFLGLDARPFNPLLAALPRVLHVSGATLGADSWVASFLRAAVVESNQRRPGGEAVLERMSEMLFVEVLRRHIDALAAGRDGVAGRACATPASAACWRSFTRSRRCRGPSSASPTTPRCRARRSTSTSSTSSASRPCSTWRGGACRWPRSSSATRRRSSSRSRREWGTRARPRSPARSSARWAWPRARGAPDSGPAGRAGARAVTGAG